MHKLIEQGYIPLDKSWIIRMGVLDYFDGQDYIFEFLDMRDNLCDDLQALSRALKSWNSGEVDVGESGTLYRFLKFASWKFGLDKKFILAGTLKQRKICDDPKIVGLSLEKLLELDGGTSQWASAAVLFGNKEIVENPPFKLKLTYEAVECYSPDWEPRYDKTILKQALSFLKGFGFTPKQAEDYCFARVFGFITREEGERRWPSLRGHESDRILEMEKQIDNMRKGKEIDSKDHRVVQAIAMFQESDKDITHPEVVNKSWPQFWKFLRDAPTL